MIASDAPADHLHELAQLLRVRRMRVEAAQRALAVQGTAVDKAEAAAAQARDALAHADAALLAYRHRLASESAADLVAAGAMATHFRARLEHEIDEADLGVARSADALAEAQRRLDECRRTLRREQSRHDAIEEAAQRARIAVERAAQSRDEEDVADLRRPTPQEGMA